MTLAAGARWLVFGPVAAVGCALALDLDSVNERSSDGAGDAGRAGDENAGTGGTIGAAGADGGAPPIDAGVAGEGGDGGSSGGSGAEPCPQGFGDCDGEPGCETRLDAKRHCGACDFVCVDAAVCRVRGASATCEAPAIALDGQRWELPCGAVLDAGAICQNLPAGVAACPASGYAPPARTVTFGGEAGVVYDVTLRIAGAVEPKVYTGGTSSGDHFYVGGVPAETAYNPFTIAVSEPASVYHLNFDEGAGEARVILVLDHEKTIPVAGGATLTLTTSDRDCRFIRNCVDIAAPECSARTAPGVAPAPGPAGGQVLQLNVVAVAPRADDAAP